MHERDAISRHDDMGWPLCPLDALAADTARGFSLSHADGRKLELIVWHQPQGLRGFINHCPHLGLPLETFPDRFLSADGSHLICSAHGAQFDAAGNCFAGPCKGRALTELALTTHQGTVYLTAWPDAQPGNMRDK